MELKKIAFRRSFFLHSCLPPLPFLFDSVPHGVGTLAEAVAASLRIFPQPGFNLSGCHDCTAAGHLDAAAIKFSGERMFFVILIPDGTQ